MPLMNCTNPTALAQAIRVSLLPMAFNLKQTLEEQLDIGEKSEKLKETSKACTPLLLEMVCLGLLQNRQIGERSKRSFLGSW